MASGQIDENLEWIKSSLKFAIPSLIIYSLCSYYLILWVQYNYSLVVPLGLILLQKLISILIALMKVRKYKFEWLTVLDSILKTLFIALLILACFDFIKVIFAGAPLYASNILLSILSYKNPSNFAICIHVFGIIIQWSFTVAFIFLSLRYQETIDWPWLYLFWPLWLIISLSCISAFLYIVKKIVLWLKESIKIIYPLWLFLNIFGISLTFGLFIVNLCSYINYKDKNVFIRGCAIFGSFLLFSALTTLAVYKYIVQWIADAFRSFAAQEPQSPAVNRPLRNLHKSMFLSKISSTFYKTINQKIQPQESEEEEEKGKNKSISSIKDCLICYSNECDSVLIPCGHGGICNDCSIKLLESGKDCHICRNSIEKVLKINKKDNIVINTTVVENEIS
ncbi:hypothetical protein SteCoe_26127 [Stentor coeruleus]|uniref:RING-type domain-containing protein n=1 Tax=Stentor coeruleus TaxID=5963 RepID=A0A1R2BDQ0_9CILI|nr:hypothetical protein SteCoe_26127 [Stentor coeruleus]